MPIKGNVLNCRMKRSQCIHTYKIPEGTRGQTFGRLTGVSGRLRISSKRICSAHFLSKASKRQMAEQRQMAKQQWAYYLIASCEYTADLWRKSCKFLQNVSRLTKTLLRSTYVDRTHLRIRTPWLCITRVQVIQLWPYRKPRHNHWRNLTKPIHINHGLTNPRTSFPFVVACHPRQFFTSHFSITPVSCSGC
jgi:hypothetical protein